MSEKYDLRLLRKKKTYERHTASLLVNQYLVIIADAFIKSRSFYGKRFLNINKFVVKNILPNSKYTKSLFLKCAPLHFFELVQIMLEDARVEKSILNIAYLISSKNIYMFADRLITFEWGQSANEGQIYFLAVLLRQYGLRLLFLFKKYKNNINN